MIVADSKPRLRTVTITDQAFAYGLTASLIGEARVISLVGAGGKKTTLYALARALRGRVALASSSHMAAYDTTVVNEVVTLRVGGLSLPVPTSGRIVAFGGEAESAERIHGLSFAQIAQLVADPSFDHVLIKADGARARWIKAPAAYEPVVPPGTDRVLYLISAQVIGELLDERIAHRVERIAAVCGTQAGAPLTVEHLATLLASEAGALQGIGQAELLPVINMVDNNALAAQARAAACRALSKTMRFERVVLANMQAARVIDIVTRAACEERVR